MKEKKQKIINVKRGNEFLVDNFVRKLYRRPDAWSGGTNFGESLIVEHYPGFNIEGRFKVEYRDMYGTYHRISTKGTAKDFNTKIVITNLSNDIKNKLIYLATVKPSIGFSEIEELAGEIKSSFLWKLKFPEVRA